MRYHNHIEAMNTIGMFLGDYGFTNGLIIKSAKENGCIGIGYYMPDGSYFSWSKGGVRPIGYEIVYKNPFDDIYFHQSIDLSNVRNSYR